MPYISVIIVNYNAGQHLTHCLESLAEQTYRDFNVFVVDNASTDGSLDAIEETFSGRFKGFQLICNKTNIGFAAANNQAIRRSSSPWLATLNPDAFPERHWLERLSQATKLFPETTMFGSTQISAEDTSLLDGCGDLYHILGVPLRGHYKKPVKSLPDTGEVFAPCAAAALYRRDVFIEAGGFDEQFFCYCEDIDLAFRLRLMGERCLQIKEAAVYHVGKATPRSSSFTLYHGMRNRYWVFVKNMPIVLFIPLFPIHMGLQMAFLTRALLKGQFRTAWSGLSDGVDGMFSLWQKRRAVQKKRKASLLDLIHAFTFSPWKIFTRTADVRTLDF